MLFNVAISVLPLMTQIKLEQSCTQTLMLKKSIFQYQCTRVQIAHAKCNVVFNVVFLVFNQLKCVSFV